MSPSSDVYLLRSTQSIRSSPSHQKKKAATGWPRPALWPATFLGQLRGELGQVGAPVDPGMPAGALFEHRLEAVLLEKIHRRLGGGDQPVVFAGAEPEQ